MSPGQVLGSGASGDLTSQVQTKLGLEPSGQFDASTAKAVRGFQRENGLDVDGLVGRETAASLNGGLGLRKNQHLRKGGDGAQVERLQNLLNQGGSSLDVDGKFGPKTQAAVRQFQQKNGLQVDGIVGPKTQAALNKNPLPEARPSPGQSPPLPSRKTEEESAQNSGSTEAARSVTQPSPASPNHDPSVPKAGQLPGVPKGLDTQGQYNYFKNLVEANGGTFDPSKPTVVGLRGVDPSGKRRDSDRNVGPYGDTFALLNQKNGQPSVQYFRGSTHAGQRRGPNPGGVAQIRPGHYQATPNGKRYGMNSYHVKTPSGNGRIPAFRDRNADGTISQSEKNHGLKNNTKATEILFHNGRFNSQGSSIGCQTMDPKTYSKFASALGARGQFNYHLINANQPTPGGPKAVEASGGAATPSGSHQPQLYLGQGDRLSQRHTSRGPQVEQLQKMLNQNGASLATDGVLGRNTTQAIKNFQRKRGLSPDGIVGPKTLSVLNGGQAPQGSSPPSSGTTSGGSGRFRNVTAESLGARLPAKMRSLAQDFVDAGQVHGIDPRFLAAISMLETRRGTSSAFRNKNNAMGVSNSRGPIRFSNKSASIHKMARTLANPRGYYRNATTINRIGRIYAPPGAGNDPHGTNGYWPRGVSKYYRQLGGDPSAQVVFR